MALQAIANKAAKLARRNKMTNDCKTTVEQRMEIILQLLSELQPSSSVEKSLARRGRVPTSLEPQGQNHNRTRLTGAELVGGTPVNGVV